MAHPVITINEQPATPQGRAQQWLRGKRFMLAGALAAFEVIVYLIAQPGSFVGLLVVGAILAGCLALTGRTKPGLGHDLLLIAALAQMMVIALPILTGIVKLVVAALLVFALIALFVVIGLRFRK